MKVIIAITIMIIILLVIVIFIIIRTVIIIIVIRYYYYQYCYLLYYCQIIQVNQYIHDIYIRVLSFFRKSFFKKKPKQTFPTFSNIIEITKN